MTKAADAKELLLRDMERELDELSIDLDLARVEGRFFKAMILDACFISGEWCARRLRRWIEETSKE